MIHCSEAIKLKIQYQMENKKFRIRNTIMYATLVQFDTNYTDLELIILFGIDINKEYYIEDIERYFSIDRSFIGEIDA